ncbi:MAG: LptA/OstA family protein [Acidobacteriaceae bacterium]
MRWTIERLRLAIIVVAAVLVLSIFGSIVYGRWRLRRTVQDLPARLGIQIQSTSQGFVLSKTVEGRKLFTLHAARAISFKTGGRVSLRDVEIDVYNQQNDQADTIAGKDFEYDKDNQIVTAQGEAHITLHPPPPSHPGAATNAEAQIIHVTTHGLVFDQKTGEATCSGEVDFQYSKSTGKALGAQYFSKTGQLTLESQVVLTTHMQDRSVVVHAAHAIYDRESAQVNMVQPRYLSSGPMGDQHGSAGAATVFLRPDGSAQRMDAQISVEIASADGTGVQSSSMRVDLDDNNQPQQAHFFGGVELTQNQPTQQTVGTGRDAVVDFDGNGHAKLVTLDGNVIFRQQVEADKNDLDRTLAASHLVLHLKPVQQNQKNAKGQGRQAQLQQAEASGGAVFTSQNMMEGHPAQETSVAAQNMKAIFASGNEMQHLGGVGQTRMRMVAANGDIDTSTGDVLAIDFMTGTPNAGPARHAGPNATNAQSIRKAVQTGNVVLQQVPASKAGRTSGIGGAQNSTATAARAEYDGATDTLTLTGKPVFRDDTMEMTADRFEVQRAVGNMLATGSVLTTVRSSNQTGAGGLLSGNLATHVIARQAQMLHDSQQAIFTGQARLWQGANSIEAPVIELSQKMQTLTAYGTGACTQCVHTTFLGQATEPAQPGKPKAVKPEGLAEQGGSRGPSTYRVLSQRLLYSDAERKATFSDHVEAISSSGNVFADRAEIFLTPATVHPQARPEAGSAGTANQEAANKMGPRSNNSPQSSVERIVATGHVVVEQPGRRGTGTRLVYTANDGRFVLTGNGAHPPQVVDSIQGTVTGEVLTFSTQTQAIMVSGSPNNVAVTKTRVQKK